MKILLLGKHGQVGRELQHSLAPLGELLALGSRSAPVCGDLADLVGLSRTLQHYAPEVIVNAAAYTAVDRAEADAAAAYRVNAEAVGVLARYAAQSGALLVHFSTDYVYPGHGVLPWTEYDTTGPLNVYGASKLAGEVAIRLSGCRYLIFRTSWVHAAHGNNFAKTLLKLAARRGSLGVIDDQFGAPTEARLLADISAQAIPQVLREPALAGLYNVAAAGETTWFRYAGFVLAHAQAAGLPLMLAPCALNPLTTEQYPTPALRPFNSRLATTRLQTAFGVDLPDWTTGVARTLNELMEQQA